MLIRTAIEINAPAREVWPVLLDFASYGEWNPLTYRIEGAPVTGAVLKLHVKLGKQQLVREHVVSRVEKNAALCWRIQSNSPWWIRGERCQRLEELGDGRCRYQNEERVEGLVSLVVALIYQAKIRRGLEAVGEALKRVVEDP